MAGRRGSTALSFCPFRDSERMTPNPFTPPAATRDAGDPGVARRPGVPGCLSWFFLFFGGVGASLGSVWIYTFGLTDYRAHLSYVGLPLGVVTLMLSLVFVWFGFATMRQRERSDG